MSISVSQASPEEWPEASAFIFADAAADDQDLQINEFLETIKTNQYGQKQLLVARENGILLGAGVLIFTDASTAFFWPPFTTRTDCAAALLQEMAARIDQSEVSIGQALLEPGQLNLRRLLTQNGFPHLTNLLFMRHPLTEIRSHGLLSANQIRSVPFDEQTNRHRFLELLDLTHQLSYDCPALNHCRTAEESLESHRSSGDSDQKHWYLFQHENTDLGVLLLSEHRSENLWEVVYMGVAPEQRGKGYGAALIQFGLQQALAHHQSALMLAVDHKNSYAIKIYEESGFIRQNTLSVHARMRSHFSGKKPKIH
ncbi:GNAT family N-acetyltransferase [Gimesia algae]|uniref:Mycothiol acetyltransferase n=1 Tax=Gimesia algae TaxID=2527971 RepID=A0A517VD24_9PLAN|nr:GNAT family N-acetyltransferase [Gimesia algae]QDT90905.1 Mycothiol acetyltransferase [Gimesia algae]